MFKKFLFITLVVLITPLNVFAGGVPLSWVYERTWGNSTYELKIYKVDLVQNKMRFSLLFHNISSEYVCFHASADKEMIYVDDEMGNEYFGAVFRTLNGKTNKLAPNQRKKAIYEFPAPTEGVNLINLRMGFHVRDITSTSKCNPPTKYKDINEHKIDWDISKLRE